MLSDCRQVGKDMVSQVLGMKEETGHSLKGLMNTKCED